MSDAITNYVRIVIDTEVMPEDEDSFRLVKIPRGALCKREGKSVIGLDTYRAIAGVPDHLKTIRFWLGPFETMPLSALETLALASQEEQ